MPQGPAAKLASKMASRSLPGSHVGMTPPARLMLSRGLRGCCALFGVPSLGVRRTSQRKRGRERRKRRPEKLQNQVPGGRKSPQNGLRRPLGRLLGRPGGPRGVTLNSLVAFLAILGRPGGGPGAFWGALGPSLGSLGASFGAPRGAFWRLRGALGGGPAGSLKKRPFGVDF